MLFYLGQDFLANDPLIFRLNQEVSVGQQVYVQIREKTFCLDRTYLSLKLTPRSYRKLEMIPRIKPSAIGIARLQREAVGRLEL